ncbi:NAD(P)H-hydrate dehydratase [Daejeonella oryzae]|uniref:NAD(P)H-hydrate dehydratase n=1 Tax=Daejeonella oryzae TaxID=1122943 RepID=UPI000427A07F|nr:NAD(P)H-hydrate dehydratase [Daejeonella oryzae]
MLNLLTCEQIRLTDQYTIQNKPVSSLDLMESASCAFVGAFKSEFPDINISICIYCGTGNNGGDGLAVARLLKEAGYEKVSVQVVRFSEKSTADFDENLKRLKLTGITVLEIHENDNLILESSDLIIDALLGSGLNKPLDGFLKEFVRHINSQNKKIVSIDVPSGFFAEGKIDTKNVCIHADLVLTFQRPKINFFFPESAEALKRFKVVNIGLDDNFIQSLESEWRLTEDSDIHHILKARRNFSHKGTYGHSLIIAGSEATMGAALLCADACLHAGSGLTTACIPLQGLTALNCYCPEVMALVRGDDNISQIRSGKFKTIAIGPGLGIGLEEISLLKEALNLESLQLILDADALTILSKNTELIKLLPLNTIITPHVKEFDRLFGTNDNWWDRLQLAREKASELQIVILLKNQYTFVITPDKNIHINPNGNPAMASGGMGDVLTGIITALAAQGYAADEAAIAACYIHALCGDIAHKKDGMYCIPPRYIISKIPSVINSLANNS